MGNEGDLNIKKCHKFESMTLEEAKNQKIDIYEFREAKQKIYDIYCRFRKEGKRGKLRLLSKYSRDHFRSFF